MTETIPELCENYVDMLMADFRSAVKAEPHRRYRPALTTAKIICEKNAPRLLTDLHKFKNPTCGSFENPKRQRYLNFLMMINCDPYRRILYPSEPTINHGVGSSACRFSAVRKWMAEVPEIVTCNPLETILEKQTDRMRSKVIKKYRM